MHAPGHRYLPKISHHLLDGPHAFGILHRDKRHKGIAPALEGCVVLARNAEQTSDDPYRQRDGIALDDVGFAQAELI